ncbi:pectinesterase family protein [Massilia sp. GER05]|uniref:pectinesterase family protein n=1 Tax=unclassified Massilia TaxID=2609279 RepID=UPI0039B015BD
MRRFALLACALAGAQAHAQDTRDVREPVVPPACAVLIGATTNAGRDDAARIQAAIDKCAPGHAVVLAASNDKRSFVAGPLQLRDGVTLLVDKGATLYASTDPRLFDRGAGTCGTNDASGRGCRPFILLDGVRGAGIMGTGTIDGQGGQRIAGKDETWWQIARRAQKEKTRQNVPRLIQADKARDVTLYRITLKNSPNFHVTLNNVDGFTAWGVVIDTPHDARNTDGIDPISSRNVTIAHSIIRTGDDNVAIKAGGNGPTENVSILHNRFYSGHGMSIGSETNGGVRRVLVDDLAMDGTTSGLRIKSNDMRGGRVHGIVYRDVCLRGIRSPIEITTHYEQPAQPGALIPDYAAIRMERVRSTTPGRILLQGYDDAHPLVLDLKDVAIAAGSDIKREHARVQGAFGAAADCAGRFLPFPEPAVRSGRPQLTAEQARAYDYREVLKYVGPVGDERIEPWDPLADPLATGAPLHADYTVDARAPADGATRFATVQAAVDRAVAAGGTRRIVIRIAPGTYQELVYVPPGAPPITLDGAGADPQAVRISAALDASTTGAAYRSRYAAEFEHAAPGVRAMVDALKDLPALQTTGSATVWVRANGFQARNLTIENAYNRDGAVAHAECKGDNCPDTTGGSRVHHQAVALRVDGADKAQFERVRLLGLQDTLFLSSQDGTATVRSFFHDTHIEGDVDFIFGDTIAVFKDCDIHAIGGRAASYVAAPDTNRRAKYGFVFDGCRFTSDAPGAANTQFYFARQWFHNERCTPYGFIPVEGYTCRLGDVDVYKAPNGTIRRRTLETVGKAVILRSRIGPHFEKTTPWSEWNRNGTLAHRPAQFSSDDYWDNLAGTPFAPPGQRPVPADVYLGEYDNILE